MVLFVWGELCAGASVGEEEEWVVAEAVVAEGGGGDGAFERALCGGEDVAAWCGEGDDASEACGA